MATRKPRTNPAGRRAADQTVVQAAVPLVTEQQAPAAEPATPLPSTFAASATKPGANVQASQQAFANYRLPASLIAKGATLCGGNLPAKLATGTVVLRPGKPFVARSAHNAAWAAAALACIAAKGGQATPADLLAAGVGGHSIAAYVKRGWLVQTKAE